jgi:hypothetical protein
MQLKETEKRRGAKRLTEEQTNKTLSLPTKNTINQQPILLSSSQKRNKQLTHYSTHHHHYHHHTKTQPQILNLQ